jgi:hypothetical protein
MDYKILKAIRFNLTSFQRYRRCDGPLGSRLLIRCHSHRWVLQKCHRGHLQPHGLSHCTWVR